MATERIRADLVIVGSGPGGGTLAYALRNSGAQIVLLERGDFLPVEPENQSVAAVFEQNRYKTTETWFDSDDRPFHPGNHYFVGGNTKLFGACMARLREFEFGAYELEDGLSPAWPISYEDLEPYYAEAERIYRVHGRRGDDFLESPRSGDYPFPPVPDDPHIAELRERLRAQGLQPFSLPMGIDYGPEGACVLSRQCDAFPCPWNAKSDADLCCVRPALGSGNVRLFTRAYAKRIFTDASGRRVTHLEVDLGGQHVEVSAAKFVVSCGAVNSTALLLRSASAEHSRGLANRSDQVGRNYLAHMNVALVAVDPRCRRPIQFQKTVGINDFCYPDGQNDDGWRYPLGTMQLVGKVQAGMIRSQMPAVPRPVAEGLAQRSVDWWLFSEDTPLARNRVTLGIGGAIKVSWVPTNKGSQDRLISAATRMMRRAGFPIILRRRWGVATNSHQCGTLRFGDDPASSVLDPLCKAHDLENLWAVDGSFFPSVGAGPGGPTLTIAAMALRVAGESDIAA